MSFPSSSLVDIPVAHKQVRQRAKPSWKSAMGAESHPGAEAAYFTSTQENSQYWISYSLSKTYHPFLGWRPALN